MGWADRVQGQTELTGFRVSLGFRGKPGFRVRPGRTHGAIDENRSGLGC